VRDALIKSRVEFVVGRFKVGIGIPVSFKMYVMFKLNYLNMQCSSVCC
jgi:hypothetical protein